MSSTFLEALQSEGLDPAFRPPAQGAPAAPADEAPAPGAEGDDRPGLVVRAARDVAAGGLMSPFSAMRGATKGLAETADTFSGVFTGLSDMRQRMDGDRPLPRLLPDGNRLIGDAIGLAGRGLHAVHGFLPDSHTVTGSLVEGLGQFVAGNVLAGRYLKALGLANRGGAVTQTVARDLIAGGTAFDPHEERLSNLLRDHAGLRDPVTAFLAADPSDGEAEARLKSALENGAVGGLAEGAFHAFRALRAARRGDTAAAAEAAEEAGRAAGEPEVQRLVSEEFRIRATQERWVKQSHTETETTTDRTATTTGQRTTTTESVTQAPTTGEPARPEVTFDASAGGTTMPPRIAINADEGALLMREMERARGNPQLLDREAAGVVWRNLDRMQTPEDAVALVDALERTYSEAYIAARGAAQSQQQLADAANRWATSAADIAADNPAQRDLLVQAMAADLGDARRIGARALAYSALTASIQRRAAEMAEQVILAAAGRPFTLFNGDRDALMAAFLRDTNLLANIDPLTLGLRSQFGRNLSMLNGIVDGAARGADALAAAVTEAPGPTTVSRTTTRTTDFTRTTSSTTTRRTIEDTIEGGERFVVELAYRIRYANTAQQARRIASRHFQGRGAWDAFSEMWTGALLSSPKTHMVGALASTFRLGLQTPVERLMAGVLQAGTGNFESGWRNMREAVYQYEGMVRSLNDAVRLAGRAMREGDSLIDPSRTQLEHATGAFNASTFGVNDNSFASFVVNGLGAVARAPSNLLVTQDEFFKQLAYRGRVYAMARREAGDMGLNAQQAAEHIERRIAGSLDGTTGRGTQDEALAYARQITFTDEFGEGWLSEIGRGVQQFKARAPWFHVVMPFVRVPTNVLREVVNTNPITAGFQREFRAELAAGGDRAAMAMSRLGTGTAVSLLAVHWALDGTITGAGPSNPQARRGQSGFDYQPNSIRITDDDGTTRYISYNRADPFGVILSIAATIADIARDMEMETRDSRLDDAIFLMVAGATKALASKTYATGLLQVASAIADGDARTEVVLRSLAATLVPAITRDLSHSTYGNEYFREATTIAEAMRARTPGFGDVDVRFNALGDPVRMPTGAGPSVVPQAVLNVISPFAMTRVDGADTVGRELLRLQMHHNAGFSPPSPNPGNVGIDLRDFRLPEGGTAHGRLQQLVGEVTPGGRNIRAAFETLFASERYARATDGTGDINGTRMQMVQSLFQGYHQAALAELQKELPEVRDAIRARMLLQRDVQREGGPAVIERRRRPQAPTLEQMFENQP
jgi:hypothetical protein